MTITLNGTTGITTPAVTNEGAYTGDGVSFADSTPSNTLVTTTGGNVGIGTSSPSTKLEVYNSTNADQYWKTSAVSLYAQANNSNASGIFGTLTNHPLVFWTNSAERMRIDSSGNVGIGTTASGDVNVNNMNFYKPDGSVYIGHVSGTATGIVYVGFGYAGNRIGSIAQSGTNSVVYNTSSDYRLKENIAPMTGALAKVGQLKPVTYTWKSDGFAGQGFIAHELQEVVPDCVTGEKDAVDADGKPVYQGIDTSFLVATLTAAIQELKTELDTVKTELATLKGTA